MTFGYQAHVGTFQQDLGMYKAAIVPLQPQQGGLWLFRRKPILTIAGGDGLRDEVFLLAQVSDLPSQRSRWNKWLGVYSICIPVRDILIKRLGWMDASSTHDVESIL